MAIDMMIDLETFGKGERALVVQVGVAVFDPEADFVLGSAQWTVDGDSARRLGGEFDASTVAWWLGQSDAARASVSKPNSTMAQALAGVAGIYQSAHCSRVWSHGATFDIPILAGYYRRLGQETPWGYSSARDTRTLFELAEQLAGWKRPRATVAHTAEADAVAQARDTQEALRALREGRR